MNKKNAPRITALQGQYLAFIRMYTLLHRQAPAESDMQQFFRVTPPTVHSMILALERHGLIQRVPGQARSIRLLIASDAVPPLAEPVE
jgi:DNA-binding MarR family transcriptional regulator